MSTHTTTLQKKRAQDVHFHKTSPTDKQHKTIYSLHYLEDARLRFMKMKRTDCNIC